MDRLVCGAVAGECEAEMKIETFGAILALIDLLILLGLIFYMARF